MYCDSIVPVPAFRCFKTWTADCYSLHPRLIRRNNHNQYGTNDWGNVHHPYSRGHCCCPCRCVLCHRWGFSICLHTSYTNEGLKWPPILTSWAFFSWRGRTTLRNPSKPSGTPPGHFPRSALRLSGVGSSGNQHLMSTIPLQVGYICFIFLLFRVWTHFFSDFTTANSSPYGTYTPIGAGGCQLGCCKPTPYYTSSYYTSSYPSPPPTYGAIPSVTPMASPKLDPYDTYTPTRARGCQLGCCKPASYYNSPYISSYTSTFPTYGAVPSYTPNAYYGLEKDSELEGGGRSGLWKIFGWGLWFCGLAVMIAHGPRSAY